MNKRYIPREVAGDLVFGLLSESDATLAEGCARLGITPVQFRHGLEYVKDVLASDSGTPIVCDPSTHRYSLALAYANGADRVREYEAHRLKVALRQLERLRTGTAEPAAALLPRSVTVRRFLRHLEGASEELAMLLEELGAK